MRGNPMYVYLCLRTKQYWNCWTFPSYLYVCYCENIYHGVCTYVSGQCVTGPPRPLPNHICMYGMVKINILSCEPVFQDAALLGSIAHFYPDIASYYI